MTTTAAAERLIIRGGNPLRGRVAVSGSKNAALYAVAATLLTAQPMTLRNVPAIADIGEMAALLRDLGASVEVDGETMRVEARHLSKTAADPERAAALRASFLVMGPLLGRLGEAACPPPGGAHVMVEVIDGGRLHSARDLAKDDSTSSWNRIGVWSTEKDGLGLL